jgi:AraC-like DNA-binding protein
MLRVLQQGMQLHGLNPRLPMQPQGGDFARVGIDLKRLLLGSALQQGGWAVLPQLGQGLHRLSHEPTHAALAAARDAEDLLQRWQRLERYIHSSHRMVYARAGTQALHLTHQAKPGLADPQPAESLVVLGVLAALLEAIGAVGVEVWMAGVQVYPSAAPEALGQLVQQQATGTWEMRWQGIAGTAAEAPPSKPRAPLEGLPLMRVGAWPALAQQASALFLRDLMSTPDLAQTAAALSVAPRTLQRHLAEAGLGFSALLAQSRVLASSRHLLHSEAPLAEVGFLCGFSDQAHFTRAFKRQVGLTPARYRTEFADQP